MTITSGPPVSLHIVSTKTADSQNPDLVAMEGIVILHVNGTANNWRREDLVIENIGPEWASLRYDKSLAFLSLNGIYKGNKFSQGGWAIDMVHLPQLNPDTRKLNLLADIAILTDNSSILRMGFHVTANGTLA
jgi:hypothetical protein